MRRKLELKFSERGGEILIKFRLPDGSVLKQGLLPEDNPIVHII